MHTDDIKVAILHDVDSNLSLLLWPVQSKFFYITKQEELFFFLVLSEQVHIWLRWSHCTHLNNDLQKCCELWFRLQIPKVFPCTLFQVLNLSEGLASIWSGCSTVSSLFVCALKFSKRIRFQELFPCNLTASFRVYHVRRGSLFSAWLSCTVHFV